MFRTFFCLLIAFFCVACSAFSDEDSDLSALRSESNQTYHFRPVHPDHDDWMRARLGRRARRSERRIYRRLSPCRRRRTNRCHPFAMSRPTRRNLRTKRRLCISDDVRRHCREIPRNPKTASKTSIFCHKTEQTRRNMRRILSRNAVQRARTCRLFDRRYPHPSTHGHGGAHHKK